MAPHPTWNSNTIRVSAESLLSIVNDILDVSKIEAGRMEFEECLFDIATVIEGVADILAPRLVGKNIEMSVYIAPELDGDFLGDPGRIRQVLMNLGGNAVKFTEKGIVAIKASREVLEDGTEWLYADVIDSGVGIAETDRPRCWTVSHEPREKPTICRHRPRTNTPPPAHWNRSGRYACWWLRTMPSIKVSPRACWHGWDTAPMSPTMAARRSFWSSAANTTSS